MTLEQLPLERQVDLVFQEVKNELFRLSSGTIFIQIRNNIIGKFGVRHDPLQSKGGVLQESETGLSEAQQHSFRRMAIESLKHKVHWTHGEIAFEFAIKQKTLCASVQFESNYNMSNILVRNP